MKIFLVCDFVYQLNQLVYFIFNNLWGQIKMKYNFSQGRKNMHKLPLWYEFLHIKGIHLGISSLDMVDTELNFLT